MSYYILPKNNNIIDIEPCVQSNPLKPYTCFSLYYFYYNFKKENYILLDSKICEDIIKIINPYEFIFSVIPGSKITISKLHFFSSIFYDFLEIVYTLNVFEFLQNKNISSIHISPNFTSSIECMEILREGKIDINIGVSELICENYKEKEFDFIFYDLPSEMYENHQIYTINMLTILKFILKSQIRNGSCIIKISMLFYKSIIDVIYLLSSMYEKVYIIKPNTSNIIKFEKYIVCKGFVLNEKKSLVYTNYLSKISSFLNEYELNENISNDLFISNIIKNDIPFYFISKIDDINIIIGQQLLEGMNQLINIIKNKNRDVKLDNIKKMNIQKCIQWCEKFNIPCNKFIEKPNIFLRGIDSEMESS
jgi:hypothetical protein